MNITAASTGKDLEISLDLLARIETDWDGDICPPPRKWPPKRLDLSGLEAVRLPDHGLGLREQVLQRQLHIAITMYQHGQRLMALPGAGAEAGQMMVRSATAYFSDGYCGSVPRNVLEWLRLHFPPPPPPDWLQDVVFHARELALGVRIGGSTGQALERGAFEGLMRQFKA